MIKINMRHIHVNLLMVVNNAGVYFPVCVCRSTSVCVLRSWVTVIIVYLESRSLREDTPAAVWRWASV